MIRNFLALLLIGFLFFHCAEDKKLQTSQLGEIQWDITGSQLAQDLVEKGLLLLHSFEYQDARTIFLEAQTIDPTCLIAYWGEAMSYNHPLWRSQDQKSGERALSRGDSILQLEKDLQYTQLEQDFWLAVQKLYRSAEDKKERDIQYRDHLASMNKKYPGHHEVSAYYALSLLGAVPEGRDQSAYEMGAKVVQGILNENPDHPGALHYLIHSFDDPGHAHMALSAANRYAQVAPDATHALHMPSHIYVALGMWDQVIASNIDSWNASVNRNKKTGNGNAGSYHALQWLMYGLLQKSEVDTAQILLQNMQTYMQKNSNSGARDYMIHMTGNYLVETQDLDSSWVFYEVDETDLNISTQAVYHYYRSAFAFANKDLKSLRNEINQLEGKREKAALIMEDDGLAMCSSASNRNLPNSLDVNQALVMEYEIRALEAIIVDDDGAAEEYLKKATKLESEISYSFGPPVVVNPSFEFYGEWLTEQSRYHEAIEQYQIALKKGPMRLRPMASLIWLYHQIGDTDKAAELEKMILEEAGDNDSMNI